MCSVGVKVLGCALFANDDGKRKSERGGYLCVERSGRKLNGPHRNNKQQVCMQTQKLGPRQYRSLMEDAHALCA